MSFPCRYCVHADFDSAAALADHEAAHRCPKCGDIVTNPTDCVTLEHQMRGHMEHAHPETTGPDPWQAPADETPSAVFERAHRDMLAAIEQIPLGVHQASARMYLESCRLHFQEGVRTRASGG